jgi:hypothetical protein
MLTVSCAGIMLSKVLILAELPKKREIVVLQSYSINCIQMFAYINNSLTTLVHKCTA